MLPAEFPAAVFDRVCAQRDFMLYKQMARQHHSDSVPKFRKLLCTIYANVFPDFVTICTFYLASAFEFSHT